MRSIRIHPVAALVIALAAAPALAQTFGPIAPAAVNRSNANVSVTGTTIDDNALATAPNPSALTPEAVGDRQLMADVVSALASDARMTGASIQVEVNDGRVTLGGVARDVAQSQAARSIADGVAGSANVTNRLTTGG
jgi:osmotically-inducible protein OsmY